MTGSSIKVGINEQVLVLGGEGFVGRAICEYLQNQSITYLAPTIKKCDLLELEQFQSYLDRFINKPVHVIFCAAITRRIDDSSESMNQNIQIVSNFIKGSHSISLASLIFLSSIDVYGKPLDNPITENTPVAPTGYYATSKLTSENLLKDAWPQLPIVILRLPGMYGKGDMDNSIVSIFAKKIQEGSSIKLTKKRSPMRDYLNVLDLCKIIHHFLQKPQTETYNIATGKSIMITEIVQLIADMLRQKPKINFIDSMDDTNDIYLSNRKICKAIPDFTFTSMETGIKDYILSNYL